MKLFYEPFEPGQPYTFDEFMALEKTAEARHEFYEGQVWMFPPDTPLHNTLVQNCMIPLFRIRKQQGYEVFTTGMMLGVLPGRYYTYPDLMVLDASHYDNDACVLHNPQVIIEVLDPLWAERDRAWKCAHYRQIAALQQYFLVSQKQQLVESYRRTADGAWTHELFTTHDDVLTIADTGFQLTLREIYDEVDVPPLQPQFPSFEAVLKSV